MNEIEYLKNLIELEIERTRLGSIYYIINKFSKDFITEYKKTSEKNYNNIYKELENKKNNETKKVNENEIINQPEKPVKPEKQKIKGFPIILFLVGIAEVFIGLVIEFSFVTFCGGFVAVFSLIGIYAKLSIYKQYNENIKKYENNLYEYSQNMIEYNSKIKKRDEQINEIEKKYNMEIEKKNNELLRRPSEIEYKNNNILNILKSNILNLSTILNEKYNLNNIPTKYRNLYSISILYNYFENNLISDFDGAFTIYEQKGEVSKSIKELNSKLSELKEEHCQIYSGLNIINNSVSKIENIIIKLKTTIEEEYVQNEVDTCYLDIEKECSLNGCV